MPFAANALASADASVVPPRTSKFGVMAEAPWLTIVGIGEDGAEGLPPASLAAISAAEIVVGPPRHMALTPSPAERLEWPAPFADGFPQLLGLRGRSVVVLVSGDPFWFGAGRVLAETLRPGEWRTLPGPSCFALAASRLGWALEKTLCRALHAAPFPTLAAELAPGVRMIVTLREGNSVRDLAGYLSQAGFGESRMTVCEALGGPHETLTQGTAAALPERAFAHPVCAALEIAGPGAVLPLTSGRPDGWFTDDGQITKRPMRALTLSALAPRPGEHLWDIGAGSGSVGLEWLLCHPSLSASAIEVDPVRAARVSENAARLGLQRLSVVTGCAPAALEGLTPPHAIFIGGGLSAMLLDHLSASCAGARLVANAVTLESEALLVSANARLGGTLLRVQLAEAAALGTRRGWQPARPVVQWSVTL